MALFSKKDQKKVRETVELFANAMVEKNAEMIASLTAKDDDILYIDGDTNKKLIGFDAFMENIEKTFEEMDKIDYNIDWMFFSIVDNMCWVNIDTSCRYVSKKEKRDFVSHVTFVMEKRRGDWFIVHILIAPVRETYQIEKFDDIFEEDEMENTEIFNLDEEDQK